MPYDEIQGWFSYFKERPPDWRGDNRAYILGVLNGYKGKPSELFDSLKQMSLSRAEREREEDPNMITAKNLKNSGFLTHLMGVASRNDVEWKVAV